MEIREVEEIINEAKNNIELGISRPRFTLNEFATICRSAADKWYYEPGTGKRKEMNEGERYMLIVSELVEAFEGVRKNKKDDHLPMRLSEEVESADTLIRIFDHSNDRDHDLDAAFWEKLHFNLHRADHKTENRAKPDGKKF